MSARSKSRSPLKARPYRVPGQSIEEERERLISDVVEQWLLAAILMVVMAVLEWYRFATNLKPSPVLFTAAAVLACGAAGWRIWRVLPKIRALRQGRDGERAVGQFLEGLRAQGFRVFHDVVADGFNVDHVLIGRAGVYTIETKTWSKPAKGKAEIVFDGERIRAAGSNPDRDPVTQAKAQANWIRSLLGESVGRVPFVKPVIVFPGWYVVNSTRSFNDLWVLEAKALPAFLVNESERMSESDVQMYAYHLSRHIRAGEAT